MQHRLPSLAQAVIALGACFALAAGCATGVTTEPPASGAGGDTGNTVGTGSGGKTTTTSTTATSSITSAVVSGTTGTGVPASCVKAADCAALDDACNVGTCINSVCQATPANDGASCDDGLYCTDNDACMTGMCVGGTQKFCPSPDSCHVGACDEAMKNCGSAPGNDGASCDDGDPCTYSGTCSAGACSKGPPVDCSNFGSTCGDGVCDPVLGCMSKPKNDGAACDDGLYCTVNDTCKMGACSGVPNTCAPPNDVCLVGTCNEASKSCVAVPGNNGAACNDGNPCHVSATCSAGMCLGGVAGNNGLACNDGNSCDSGSTCSGGVCGNPVSKITMCINNDGCCPAACGNGNDNDCLLAQSSYNASVVFLEDPNLPSTQMTITFDGTNYWSCSGGGPQGVRLSKYSAAGAFVSNYMPGIDFRSVFTVKGDGPLVYSRGYSSNQIQTMNSPGVFTNGVVLSGGTLDAQASVAFNSAGTEFIAMANGNVDRWSLAGAHIQSFTLSGYGVGVPGENASPQNRGIISIGPYYLTYYNKMLSAWDGTGTRIKTVTLNGAGTSFDSYYGFSFANGMVFIIDQTGGSWRGYNVGQ